MTTRPPDILQSTTGDGTTFTAQSTEGDRWMREHFEDVTKFYPARTLEPREFVRMAEAAGLKIQLLHP